MLALINDTATPGEIESADTATEFDSLIKTVLDTGRKLTTLSDGTNQFVVQRVRQPLAESPLHGVGRFLLSDSSLDRIRPYAAALANQLRCGGDGLADVAYALARLVGRGPVRTAVVARDRAELVAGLIALAEDRPHPAVVFGQVIDPPPAPVWVFSGHQPNWTSLRTLAESEPEFAAIIDELAPLLHWATASP
ncbi:hypothetical protein [Kribbella qitaiheensis]|uniref:hypothetical protein n=1 Tax=Kribbella qitaiheensis TaxID=1544730 RepID=UPI0016297AB1|nr:hypothetical protein [Kribbella qitaiheensis]